MAGPQSGFENLLGHVGSSSSSHGSVPLQHMDYSYIGQCSHVQELEKILKALRSGKDGYYPDLIKCCEERITTLDPKCKALRKDRPPTSPGDLGREEWQQLNSEIKDWATEMRQGTGSSSGQTNEDETLPPIRQPATMDTSGKTKTDKDVVWGQPSKERIKSSDYRAWDKFDAEKATEEADQKQNIKPSAKSSSALSTTINTEGMSDKERELVANKEKDKGNEAFKAGDFEEAVQYYSRSISVIPSAPAYNNRSLARIKLSQFRSAVEDCSKVLELEPENIKALLRRGTALKSLKQLTAAKTDLESVLKSEPNNKQALDLLADIMSKECKEKSSSKPNKEHVETEPTEAVQTASPGRRMVIQEVEGESDSEEEDGGKGRGSLVDPKTGALPSDTGADNRETEAAAAATEIQDGCPGAAHDGPVATATPPVPNPVPALPLPDDVIALKDAGNELFKAGQYGNAMEKYSTAIQKICPDKESFRAALASLYNNCAACNLKTGHLKETIDDCSEALELQPYSAKAMHRRGKAYEALEKFRHAYVDYQAAMKVDSSYQSAQEGASRMMRTLSEQDGPKWREKLPSTPSILGLPLPPPSLTTMAPSASPVPSVTTTSTSAQPSMATSQVKGHKDVPAPKVESKPSARGQVDPAPVSNADAGKGSSEKVKAGSEVKGHDDPMAMTDPKLSVEDNFLTLKTKGNTLVQLGNYEKAVEFYTACIALDPKQHVSYTNRALCFIKLLKGKDAETDCTQALELDEGNIKALYRRALARKMLHKYSDGARDLTTLLRVEPHNASAKKELDLVKELWRKELKVNQQKTVETPKQAAQPPPGQQKTEVKLPKVKPKGSSVEVKPAEVKQATEKPAGVKPAEVKPPEVKPVKGKSPQVKTSGVESLEVKSAEVKSAEVKPAEAKPAEVKPAEVKVVHKKKKKGRRIQIQEVEGNSGDENDATKAQPRPTEKPPARDKKANKTPTNTGSQKGGKNPGGEDDKVTVPKLTKVTAYEFLQAWTSLKRQRSMLAYAELLKQISPEELPEVLTNKLDGDMVVNIVKAVCEHLVDSDGDLSYGLLANLPKVERFKTVALFLSASDKKRLRNTLKKFSSRKSEVYSEADIEKLQQQYSLK